MARALLSIAMLLLASSDLSAAVERRSFTVVSDPGIEIAVREVIDPLLPPTGDPVILLHGARVPGVPSFDLDVPGGSLARDLAAAGLAVYIVDLRGYGASTRLAAMNAPQRPESPLTRTGAAVRDLTAAVAAIRERRNVEQVALLGWATGGHWAGAYAAHAPETVSRLVLHNSLYGYTTGHPVLGRGSRLADPDDPERFNIGRFQNYRLNTADSLLPGWDRSIPIEDKAAWRALSVAQAYIRAALASDPTSARRDPPSFRAPSGAMADSFLLVTGAALWDARLITADVFVVRSENDFWSRPEDAAHLEAHLSARDIGEVRSLEIPDATHFVHLDRAERGRDSFLDAVTKFLTD